jgi:lipopolysaccharide transport system ATP-binding protein
MPLPAISVENLSKAYRIGLKDEVPDSLVGAIQGMLRAPWKNLRRLRRLNTFRHNGDAEDTIWALKDVSFEVAEGEVIGIIGRNGAGKSTLLKILSRITEPTSGRAVIRGRVSSLLEVGTGFHPELSGRENIYLNGTILGMTKREIDRKFDEIVDFSGVEKFLDTPVKRYSSGMTVRLAFSVAAHLEPEILIVDEVLAVGDMEFQKKCLGKMQDVARGGRTVLFVSHNLAAIRSLTTRSAYLVSGRLQVMGETCDVSEMYLSHSIELRDRVGSDGLASFRPSGMGQSPVRFEALRLRVSPEIAGAVPRLRYRQGYTIEFEVDVVSPLRDLKITATLTRDGEQRVVTLYSRDGRLECDLSIGRHRILCHIESPDFSPGTYSLEAALYSGDRKLDSIVDYPIFEIDADPSDLGIVDWHRRPWGAVHLNSTTKWSIARQ